MHNAARSAPDSAARLHALLRMLYDDATVAALAPRLLERAQGGGTAPARPNPCLLITYGDSLRDDERPPLQVLREFLAKRIGDAFGALHILPFYPSSSDDGFAVIDYRRVDHHLGTWDDVSVLANDYDLMFDLVINHCSRENLWFVDFISGRAPGCDYFITLPESTDTSAVIRPRSSPLISTVHTYEGIRHVWNTFSDDQIDLDFTNPDVLAEFVDILFFYVERGARIIRLDAVAFLWKRLGTSCMNLPETHAVVKMLRLLLEHAGADVTLITETNVPHAENITYFGAGDEAHRVYQFSLAPLMLLTYTFGDSRHLTRWAQNLEPPPAGGSCLNFIASHDGIGLRPLEGLVDDSEVEALVARMHERGGFVSLRDAGNGKQKPYEINISLFSAFGGRDADLAAFLGAHALLLAFQGVPTLYIHSLLATPNDLDLVEQTGRTRSINRSHWRLENLEAQLADPDSMQARVLPYLTNALRRHQAQPAFALDASQRVLDLGRELVVLERNGHGQRLLVIASVVGQPLEISARDLGIRPGAYREQLSERTIAITQQFRLAPYRVLWLDLTAQVSPAT